METETYNQIHTLITDTLNKKEEYTNQMKKICKEMQKISPNKNKKWYYNTTGFLQVDIHREEYNTYMEFMEKLVHCKYCYLMKDTNQITLMVSISTIKNEIEEKIQ